MPQYLSAGVYTEEADYSQVIPSTSTSVGAMVGWAKRGPINARTLSTTTKQFIDRFGYPSEAVGYAHYAALAFLEKSNQLYFTRVVNGAYTYGGMLLQRNTASGTTILDPYEIQNPDLIDFATADLGTNEENLMFVYPVDGPGDYSNTIKIGIRSDNLPTPAVMTSAQATSGGTLSAATYSYRTSAFNINGETLASTAVSVVVASGSTNVITLTGTVIPGAIGYRIYGRTGGTELYMGTVVQPSSGSTFTFVDNGSIVPAGALPATAASATGTFWLDVYDTTISLSNAVESFEVSLVDKLDGFNQQMNAETRVNLLSKYIRVKLNASVAAANPTLYTVSATAMEQGDNGTAPTLAQYQAGYDLYRNTEQVTTRLFIQGGAFTSPGSELSCAALQLYMNTVAAARKDTVAILDMPTSKQLAVDAIDYRRNMLNLNSNRAAIYSPDLRINDSYNDKVIYVPPSGHAAAVYAFTDAISYNWFAPAGLNRGLLPVLGLRYNYDQADRDMLASSQVNYARNMPGLGIALWEALTMQSKTSALSYVSVRRMLDTIQVAIKDALNLQVWEPNDDFLKRQIVGMINEYLRGIQDKRGIEDYLVVADDRNNSPAVANVGQLNVDAYILPILPAQKIRFRTIVTKQGVSFEELIASNA